MFFTMTRLGDNLKRLRKRTGMSQVKLAGVSGVSLGYITKIEQGVAGKQISAAKSKALADAGNQAERVARQSRRVRVAADLLADYEALWSGPPERANAVISDLVELILVRGRVITDIIVRQ